MTDQKHKAPILRYTRRIVRGLHSVAGRDDPVLTLAILIEVMGRSTHRLLILVLTFLNMIPGPPGFGGTLAWTTFAVSLAMVLGRPVWLPDIIGQRKLPLNLLLKASKLIDRIISLVARLSRPRLRRLTGSAAIIPYGLFTMVISVAMTVPVPFVNAVPNIGLCVLAFSMLNRDGIGVLLGIVICILGLSIEILLVLGAANLGMLAIGTVI